MGPRARHHRNRRLIIVSLIAMVGVTGHFVSYTYIVVIIRDVVGVHGPNLAWVLAAYGAAGPDVGAVWWRGRWTAGPGAPSSSAWRG